MNKPMNSFSKPAVRVLLVGMLLPIAMVFQPSWAVNKCSGADGTVSFQDAPCTGKGETLTVRPATGRQSVEPVVLAPSSLPGVPAPGAQQAVAVPALQAPRKSVLEIEAEQCLAWYRPLLRDPAGAYYREPSKESRVLSITVHATNGFGGYVPKRAACEFVNGKLDDGWTKIQAKRANWQVD